MPGALSSEFDVRAYLESLIERALAFLDALDGDPDLEGDSFGRDLDLEPSLGWNAIGFHGRPGLEDEQEPSLGWTATMALGTDDDREEERHEHGEP